MKPRIFINRSLLAELGHKRDTLLNRVSDEGGLRSALFDAAHLDAAYHSKITEPDQAVRVRHIGRRRDFRETKAKLEDARDYVKNNLRNVIDEDFLIGLSQLIQPSMDKGYRNDSVFISGYGDAGTNPQKIKEQMDALINLTNDSTVDLVERAILFHLHFLRIHPFLDGNGRTARCVQNSLLALNNYAPAILEPAERTFYNDLLHKARRSFKEREADGDIRAPELMAVPAGLESPESEFLHYMATKVNVGMDRLITDYDNLPHYQIQLLGFSDPGEVMRVKKILQGYFKQAQFPAHISVTNKKRGMLEVRADTNDRALTKILEAKSRNGYKIFRYS